MLAAVLVAIVPLSVETTTLVRNDPGMALVDTRRGRPAALARTNVTRRVQLDTVLDGGIEQLAGSD